MRLINNYGKPIVLDGGTILAAAGTKGSTKEVESISERDQGRYVDKGFVSIAVDEPVIAAKVPPVEAQGEEEQTAKGKEQSEEERLRVVGQDLVIVPESTVESSKEKPAPSPVSGRRQTARPGAAAETGALPGGDDK